MTAARCSACGAEGLTDRLKGLCPQCLFADSPPADWDPLPPGPFGPLEILQKLGHGGMGVVYKARQASLDRTVALKVLSPALAADPEFRDRFAREAHVLAKLNHPNIVAVHDFGERDGLYFLVLEFVDGTSLRSLLESRGLSPDELLKLIPPLCEALEYAHAQGVVHRDVKPENILVDRKGRLKIADFGIAKLALSGVEGLAVAGRKITRAGVALGTPDYMAPEQREGFEAADHRADLYSLGAVLYEILTGKLPARRFVRPSRIAKTDPRLDRIVQRALARQPERRYATAAQIHQEITVVLSSPPPPRRRWPWLAAAGGLLALAILFAVGLSRPRAGPVQAAPPQDDRVDTLLKDLASDDIQTRERATDDLLKLVAADRGSRLRVLAEREKTSDPEVRGRLDRLAAEIDFLKASQAQLVQLGRIEAQAAGTPQRIASSPDGKHIASWGPDRRLVLLNADLRELSMLATTEGDVGTLRFSPDGTRLGVTESHAVSVYEIETGRRLARLPHKEVVRDACFSSDATHVFTASHDGMRMWDIGTGEEKRMLAKESFNAIRVTPDGTTLLAQSDDQGLTRWSTRDWTGTDLAARGSWHLTGFRWALALSPDGSRIAQGRKTSVRSSDVVVWDVASGKEVFRTPLEGTATVALDSAGGESFACGSDHEIAIFAWKDFARSGTVKPGSYAFAFSDAGTHLLVPASGELRKIEARTGKPVAWAKPHKGRIADVAFQPDGKSLATVGHDGMVRFLDLERQTEVGAFDSGRGPATLIEISRDATRLAVADAKGAIAVFDLGTRRLLCEIPGDTEVVNAMRFAAQGTLLVAHNSGEIAAYDTGRGAAVRTFGEWCRIGTSYSSRERFDFSPDDQLVARAANHWLDVWNAATGVRLLKLDQEAPPAIRLSADKSRLFCADRTGEVKAIEISSGKTLQRASYPASVASWGPGERPGSLPLVMSVDPTGRYLALAWPGKLVLLHAASLREALAQETTRDVQDVRVSPDGRLVVLRESAAVTILEVRPAK